MIWLLAVFVLLAMVGGCAYGINDACKNDIAVFARRIGTCKTLTDIVRLEADIIHYRHSQCWFEWNQARCAALLQRLRHMRALAELDHR